MTRGTELLLLLAVLCLALTGFVASPVPMFALGTGLGVWGMRRADRDELVWRFG